MSQAIFKRGHLRRCFCTTEIGAKTRPIPIGDLIDHYLHTEILSPETSWHSHFDEKQSIIAYFF